MTLRKPLLIFFISLAAWGGFSALSISWAGWQPATCLAAGGCFCEAVGRGTLAQPANAWSSLIYLLPGLLILCQPGQAERLFDTQPAYRWIFGTALLVIGLGSAFYHASLTFVGQFMDVMGMYLLISFAAVYRAACLARFNGRITLMLYLAVNLLLAVVLIGLPGIRREVFGAWVAVFLGLEVWYNRRPFQWRRLRGFVLALAAMAAAYGIWILDNNRVLCSPQSWLQGHALWHLLGALAAWLLFRYFSAEPAGA